MAILGRLRKRKSLRLGIDLLEPTTTDRFGTLYGPETWSEGRIDEPCEGCEFETDPDDLQQTDDGVWLCPQCWAECEEATP